MLQLCIWNLLVLVQSTIWVVVILFYGKGSQILQYTSSYNLFSIGLLGSLDIVQVKSFSPGLNCSFWIFHMLSSAETYHLTLDKGKPSLRLHIGDPHDF